MKDNYNAWQIYFKDFFSLKNQAEKLAFFVHFGILAPSSHNSQPWKFKIVENGIEIEPDFNRALLSSDKNNRQLYISIGCAAYNIKKSAECYGYNVNINFKKRNNYTVVEIILGEKTFPENLNYLSVILNRVTNRNKYEDKLSSQAISVIKELNIEEISVKLFTDRREREQITNIVMSSTEEAMGDKNFRNELSRYIKSNITKSPIGMPAFGMGIPTPPSLLASFMIKHFNMNRLDEKKNADLLANHTPAFVIISTPGDMEIDWIKTGLTYQNIALELTKIGYATNPMAAPIQIEEHYLKLKKFLKNKNNRPQFFFRVGMAKKKTPHSPRINANSVII